MPRLPLVRGSRAVEAWMSLVCGTWTRTGLERDEGEAGGEGRSEGKGGIKVTFRPKHFVLGCKMSLFFFWKKRKDTQQQKYRYVQKKSIPRKSFCKTSEKRKHQNGKSKRNKYQQRKKVNTVVMLVNRTRGSTTADVMQASVLTRRQQN